MLNVSALLSDAWRPGMFQAITSVASPVAQSERCPLFEYFRSHLCSVKNFFLWIAISPMKGKRNYKLHSQDTQTSPNPYKLPGVIVTAIPNQASRRHRQEQLARELDWHGVVMSLRLGRMNLTSASPLHNQCTDPQLLWPHTSAGD